MEINRIQKLAAIMPDGNEKEEILRTIDVLSAAFEQMIYDARTVILGEEAPHHDFSEARTALRRLHEQGCRYDMEFPAPESDRAVLEYVRLYGTEIVRGGKKQ